MDESDFCDEPSHYRSSHSKPTCEHEGPCVRVTFMHPGAVELAKQVLGRLRTSGAIKFGWYELQYASKDVLGNVLLVHEDVLAGNPKHLPSSSQLKESHEALDPVDQFSDSLPPPLAHALHVPALMEPQGEDGQDLAPEGPASGGLRTWEHLSLFDNSNEVTAPPEPASGPSRTKKNKVKAPQPSAPPVIRYYGQYVNEIIFASTFEAASNWREGVKVFPFTNMLCHQFRNFPLDLSLPDPRWASKFIAKKGVLIVKNMNPEEELPVWRLLNVPKRLLKFV